MTTYTDVTASVAAQENLAIANETLEGRVKERTRELERLNAELIRAKALAEEANASKTHSCAASHDILQPLNAARLYASAFAERPRAAGAAKRASHVDGSLEVIKGVVSSCSTSPNSTRAPCGPNGAALLDELCASSNANSPRMRRQKALSYASQDRARSSTRTDCCCAACCRICCRTPSNIRRRRRLVGARRRGVRVLLEVWDSGVGIAEAHRLRSSKSSSASRKGCCRPRARPSAVDRRRLADLLATPLEVRCTPGRGRYSACRFPRLRKCRGAISAADRFAPSGGHAGCARRHRQRASILSGMRALLEGWGCVSSWQPRHKTQYGASKRREPPISSLPITISMNQTGSPRSQCCNAFHHPYAGLPDHRRSGSGAGGTRPLRTMSTFCTNP